MSLTETIRRVHTDINIGKRHSSGGAALRRNSEAPEPNQTTRTHILPSTSLVEPSTISTRALTTIVGLPYHAPDLLKSWQTLLAQYNHH